MTERRESALLGFVKRGVFAFVLLGAACAGRARDRSPSEPEVVNVDPRLPVAPSGPTAPSLAHAVKGITGERIADVDSCSSCHADVAAAWRKSAHAFASFNNPVYRVAVDKLRKDRDPKTSRFCGGCHDIALLVDDAMLEEIEPTDLRAHAGVTCVTCHSVSRARTDGNASWDLDASPIPIPNDGDPMSKVRHRERVGQATLRTAAMCSSCHKAFLDKGSGNAVHLIGQDDATPWNRSVYAGSHTARVDEEVAEKDCLGCHMPRAPAVLGDQGAKSGTVASHLFLGAHTWLAAMQNDPGLVEKARAFLAKRVSLDIAGVRHGDGRHELVHAAPLPLVPGEDVVVDVAIRNLDVGHRFPGGVTDAQDTWIEITIDDARGKRVAESGNEHEVTGADPTTHVLSMYMAQADGTRLRTRETHEFRAGVWNHTIAPRDAAVVGFGFVAPKEAAAYPLKVSARLRHRTRNLELQRAACAATRSERGRAFGQVGLRKVARAIDACRAQPVTDLAKAEVVLGAIAARKSEPREDAFARRSAYALGLMHSLQERFDDARLPLASALDLAATPRERAVILSLITQVASREGRSEETMALAERADAAGREAGMTQRELSANLRARADVLASTWKLAEAAPLFFDVAQKNPRDDGAWAQAAIAFGGEGDARKALEAARRGLEGQPRDADMLRIQSIALRSLRVENKEADSAFLERRAPDDAPGIRAKCSENVAGCANERVPVHVHAMRMR